MMDNPEYVKKAVEKLIVYSANGIIIGENLILTLETKGCPLTTAAIKRQIDKYLL